MNHVDVVLSDVQLWFLIGFDMSRSTGSFLHSRAHLASVLEVGDWQGGEGSLLSKGSFTSLVDQSLL